MRATKITLAALLALGLAFGAQAYLGRVVKPPCGGAADILDPSKGLALSLYVAHSGDPNAFMWYIDDSAAKCGCNAWNAGGAYDCNILNFGSCVSGAAQPANDATVWAIATYFENGTAGGTHIGHLMLDATCGAENNMGQNVTQTLGEYSAAADMHVGPFFAQGGASGTNSGFDLRWDAVSEYGRTVGICSVGGPIAGSPNCAAVLPLKRAIIGYNVYRIPTNASGGIDPAVADPNDYLFGCMTHGCANLAAGNAHHGWIGFVPIAYDTTVGLNLNNPDLPAASTDNNVNDQWGVQGRDVGGDTTVDLSDIATIILSDGVRNTTAGKTLTAAELAGSYAYVVQPVIRGTPNAVFNGIQGKDLNGDTKPDFLSPQCATPPGALCGLGLTAYDSAGNVYPLISETVSATGTNATPSTDSLQFQGVYNDKTRGFDLSFVSALEGNVAGFNLYRSAANNESSFAKLNDVLIPAKGTALSTYVYSDRIQVRRESATYYYKVEAVMLDGSTRMYGPFQVTYSGETEQRRGRGLR